MSRYAALRVTTPEPVRPPAPVRTFLVTFCVRDCYRIRLDAEDESDAILKAENLYDTEHEAAFEFDLDNGGTCDWHAEEVAS